MAVTLEQVEQLREKAEVSYADARTALEQSDGDLLDALIWLEQHGRLHTDKGGFYSTDGTGAGPAAESLPLPVKTEKQRERKSLKDLLGLCWRALIDNELEIWRKGKMLSSVPVLILLILLALGFWVVIPALVVGLFLGCRYTFAGPNLGREDINDIMDTVSDTADQIKSEFQKYSKKEH